MLKGKFGGKWFIDGAFAVAVRIVPETVVAMAVIVPARMVDDWVKTNTFDGDAHFLRTPHFIANIREPFGARIAFRAGLGKEKRAMIAAICFFEDKAQRAVLRMRARDREFGIERRCAANPLIVRVVVDADDVQVFLRAS